MSDGPTERPRIARIWRGRTKRERADEYEAYNYEVGIKPLIQKALGVQCLRDDRETETEFVTISYWESVEAMSRFAGSDPTRIHHLPRDHEFLIELPERVQISHRPHVSREYRRQSGRRVRFRIMAVPIFHEDWRRRESTQFQRRRPPALNDESHE